MAEAARRDESEAAYRRGVHQALARAADLVAGCRTLQEARDLIDRAEAEARALRHREPAEGVALLDELAARLRGRGRVA